MRVRLRALRCEWGVGQIAAKMEAQGDDDAEVDDLDPDADDLELRLARLEHLMDRRPELLSSVLLRQNPHNVHEWHKRVEIYKKAKNIQRVIYTYAEAVKTVEPPLATGKPHTLWVAFAKFYEEHGDLNNSRTIFEKAVQVPYKSVEDLSNVWCEYAEMEIRNDEFDNALKLMQRATQEPTKKQKMARMGQEETVQGKVHRSTKLWMFYVDLEESLGTLESTKAVYEKILDMKIATPQLVINFALLLEEHKFFEDSFKAYERGVNLFKYPHVHSIWEAYLSKFTDR